MRLRYHPDSPHGRKLKAFLALRGDDVALDPRADVEMDREPILETLGGAYVGPFDVVVFLEEQDRILVPEPLRARVEDMDRMLELYLVEPCITMETWPGTIAAHKAWQTAYRSLAMIEDRLLRSHFVVGTGLTLADLTAAIGAAAAEEQGMRIPPLVQAYLQRLRRIGPIAEAVPSSRRVVALPAGRVAA